MKKERLMELAGVQLNEAAPKTTKENPLVYVWETEKSTDYPEQGLKGHMHITTAAKIEGFSPDIAKTLLKDLNDAGPGSDIGKGKRFKAFGVWLEYSHWNKKHLKESQLNEEQATRTVLIRAEREVEVYANSEASAIAAVKDMYRSGDAAAELESPKFTAV